MPTTSGDPVSTLRAAVKRWHDRFAPGPFGVACSGGADSIALADAAIAELGASSVVVIHVDHGLSAGSASVAEAVAGWARGQGARAVVRRIEVLRRASIEAAARDARYAALDDIARELELPCIFLGHTARDQAETVLMRIVRGTGPAGLAGIPVVRGRFVRPFLDLPREQVDAYVAARGLPTWEDPMNADLAIARIRVREQLLPALRAENPAVDDALCRLAASAREWTEALDALAAPIARFPIHCPAAQALPAAVRKRAYAIALEHHGLGYDAAHLDAIDELVLRPARGEVGVDIAGARVVRRYETLVLDRPGANAGSLHETARPLVAPPGYELRVWRPGDRMRPARLKGRSRKLSDLYIDAKVPRELRRTARVLVRVADQSIVWAEHLGIAFGVSPDILPEPGESPGSF